MTRTLFIKNMVCNRCKIVILQLLNDYEVEVEAIQLGKVTIKDNQNINSLQLVNQLNNLGFELIQDPTKVLVEKIKVHLIRYIEMNETNIISTTLENVIGKSYSILSKTFSKSEGVTLEKYFINLKIEKVKELIQLQEHNFSQIAYSLNYKSSSHLARQFKQVTGMSMTAYRKLQNWDRRSLDRIV